MYSTSFKHTLAYCIRLNTLGEAVGAIENQHFSWRQQLPPHALQREAYNRLARINGVKLAGLDKVSFDACRQQPTTAVRPTAAAVGLRGLLKAYRAASS